MIPDRFEYLLTSRPQSSNDTAYHHLWDSVTRSLNYCANSNDCRANHDLSWSSEYISSPNSRHSANKTADIYVFVSVKDLREPPVNVL